MQSLGRLYLMTFASNNILDSFYVAVSMMDFANGIPKLGDCSMCTVNYVRHPCIDVSTPCAMHLRYTC